jgi:glycosyltransferase 2 family protein
MKKSSIISISKIVISLATVVILLYLANIPVLKSMLFSLNIKTICICTLLIFMMQAANTLKLLIVMSGAGVNFRYLLKTNLIATFFANVVPSSIGKDIIRMVYLGKSGTLRENAAAAISLDRVSGLFTQLLFLISAALWGLQYNINLNSFIILAFVIILLVSALSYITFVFRAQIKTLFSKMNISKIFDFNELYNIIKQFISSPSKLIHLSMTSIVYQALIIYNIVMLTHAFGGSIKFYQAAIVSSAITLAALIPASLAGWGIVEGAYMLLYSIISQQKETGLAVSISIRFLLLVPSFIGLILFLYDKPKIRLLKEKADR